MPFGSLGSAHLMCTVYSESSQVIFPEISSAFSVRQHTDVIARQSFFIVEQYSHSVETVMYLQAWCGRWRRLPCCSDWGRSGRCKRGFLSDSWWNGAGWRWPWIPCRKPWMKSYSPLLPPPGYEWPCHWAAKRAWCEDERKSYWPRPPEICVVLTAWAHQ